MFFLPTLVLLRRRRSLTFPQPPLLPLALPQLSSLAFVLWRLTPHRRQRQSSPLPQVLTTPELLELSRLPRQLFSAFHRLRFAPLDLW
jgi:hypothetical protein